MRVFGVCVTYEFMNYLESYFVDNLPGYLEQFWGEANLTKNLTELKSIADLQADAPPILPVNGPREEVKQSIINYCNYVNDNSNLSSSQLSELKGRLWGAKFKKGALKVE